MMKIIIDDWCHVYFRVGTHVYRRVSYYCRVSPSIYIHSIGSRVGIQHMVTANHYCHEFITGE